MEFFQFEQATNKSKKGIYYLKGDLTIQSVSAFISKLREEMQINTIKNIQLRNVETIDTCFLQLLTCVMNNQNQLQLTLGSDNEDNLMETINKLGFTNILNFNK